MPPVRTTIRSPTATVLTGTSVSVSPSVFHTLSTWRDMASARSATDFLCVQSSRSSPMCSMNMTLPAVPKSPRRRDTVTAVASRTATVSLPFASAARPARMYRNDLHTARNARMGYGRNALDSVRRSTTPTSLSSNSRLSARGVCSGTRSRFSAFANENPARDAITAVRFPV